MDKEIMEYLTGADVLADYPEMTAEQLAAVVKELADSAFGHVVSIARDVIEMELQQ
jgi:uncharacterized protein (DUF433 family)